MVGTNAGWGGSLTFMADDEVTYEQEYTEEIVPIPEQDLTPLEGEDDDYAEPEGDESLEDVEPDEDDDEGFDEEEN